MYDELKTFVNHTDPMTSQSRSVFVALWYQHSSSSAEDTVAASVPCYYTLTL